MAAKRGDSRAFRPPHFSDSSDRPVLSLFEPVTLYRQVPLPQGPRPAVLSESGRRRSNVYTSPDCCCVPSSATPPRSPPGSARSARKPPSSRRRSVIQTPRGPVGELAAAGDFPRLALSGGNLTPPHLDARRHSVTPSARLNTLADSHLSPPHPFDRRPSRASNAPSRRRSVSGSRRSSTRGPPNAATLLEEIAAILGCLSEDTMCAASSICSAVECSEVPCGGDVLSSSKRSSLVETVSAAQQTCPLSTEELVELAPDSLKAATKGVCEQANMAVSRFRDALNQIATAVTLRVGALEDHLIEARAVRDTALQRAHDAGAAREAAMHECETLANSLSAERQDVEAVVAKAVAAEAEAATQRDKLASELSRVRAQLAEAETARAAAEAAAERSEMLLSESRHAEATAGEGQATLAADLAVEKSAGTAAAAEAASLKVVCRKLKEDLEMEQAALAAEREAVWAAIEECQSMRRLVANYEGAAVTARSEAALALAEMQRSSAMRVGEAAGEVARQTRSIAELQYEVAQLRMAYENSQRRLCSHPDGSEGSPQALPAPSITRPLIGEEVSVARSDDDVAHLLDSDIPNRLRTTALEMEGGEEEPDARLPPRGGRAENDDVDFSSQRHPPDPITHTPPPPPRPSRRAGALLGEAVRGAATVPLPPSTDTSFAATGGTGFDNVLSSAQSERRPPADNASDGSESGADAPVTSSVGDVPPRNVGGESGARSRTSSGRFVSGGSGGTSTGGGGVFVGSAVKPPTADTQTQTEGLESSSADVDGDSALSGGPPVVDTQGPCASCEAAVTAMNTFFRTALDDLLDAEVGARSAISSEALAVVSRDAFNAVCELVRLSAASADPALGSVMGGTLAGDAAGDAETVGDRFSSSIRTVSLLSTLLQRVAGDQVHTATLEATVAELEQRAEQLESAAKETAVAVEDAAATDAALMEALADAESLREELELKDTALSASAEETEALQAQVDELRAQVEVLELEVEAAKGARAATAAGVSPLLSDDPTSLPPLQPLSTVMSGGTPSNVDFVTADGAGRASGAGSETLVHDSPPSESECDGESAAERGRVAVPDPPESVLGGEVGDGDLDRPITAHTVSSEDQLQQLQQEFAALREQHSTLMAAYDKLLSEVAVSGRDVKGSGDAEAHAEVESTAPVTAPVGDVATSQPARVERLDAECQTSLLSLPDVAAAPAVYGAAEGEVSVADAAQVTTSEAGLALDSVAVQAVPSTHVASSQVELILMPSPPAKQTDSKESQTEAEQSLRGALVPVEKAQGVDSVAVLPPTLSPRGVAQPPTLCAGECAPADTLREAERLIRSLLERASGEISRVVAAAGAPDSYCGRVAGSAAELSGAIASAESAAYGFASDLSRHNVGDCALRDPIRVMDSTVSLSPRSPRGTPLLASPSSLAAAAPNVCSGSKDAAQLLSAWAAVGVFAKAVASDASPPSLVPLSTMLSSPSGAIPQPDPAHALSVGLRMAVEGAVAASVGGPDQRGGVGSGGWMGISSGQKVVTAVEQLGVLLDKLSAAPLPTPIPPHSILPQMPAPDLSPRTPGLQLARSMPTTRRGVSIDATPTFSDPSLSPSPSVDLARMPELQAEAVGLGPRGGSPPKSAGRDDGAADGSSELDRATIEAAVEQYVVKLPPAQRPSARDARHAAELACGRKITTPEGRTLIKNLLRVITKRESLAVDSTTEGGVTPSRAGDGHDGSGADVV